MATESTEEHGKTRTQGKGHCCPITIYWNACNVMKENIYTDCNYTLDMNASHYKINRASPLPPGEGQGEGV